MLRHSRQTQVKSVEVKQLKDMTLEDRLAANPDSVEKELAEAKKLLEKSLLFSPRYLQEHGRDGVVQRTVNHIMTIRYLYGMDWKNYPDWMQETVKGSKE